MAAGVIEAERLLADAAATEALGAEIASSLLKAGGKGAVIYLEGGLGSGKTTLARGLLRALGHCGRVKSPTYSLLESYELAAGACLHLDLYRLEHAEELDAIAPPEMFAGCFCALIEWPDRALQLLPPATRRLSLSLAENGDKRQALLTRYTKPSKGCTATRSPASTRSRSGGSTTRQSAAPSE